MTGDRPHRIVPFSTARVPTLDFLHVARGRPVIHILMQADVTDARRLVRARRRHTRSPLSLTAFVAACVARAAAEHPHVHAYRDWRGRLVLFEDVDILATQDRLWEGQRIATAHVIRRANRKHPEEIAVEIRRALADPPLGARQFGWYSRLPVPLRRTFWWVLLRWPRLMRSIAGTVCFSSVGMFAPSGAWGLPVTAYTLQVTIGGIIRRPRLRGERLEEREYLSLTVSADHNVVDGAPAARFARRLAALIERGPV